MKYPTRIIESPSILTSEEMVDKAYDGLIALLGLIPQKKRLAGEVFGGGNATHMSAFNALVDGIYCPGSVRYYYTGHFDLSVDSLPDSGSVYVEPTDLEAFSYVTIKRVDKLPRWIWHSCRDVVANYEVTSCRLFYKNIFKLKDADSNKFFENDVSYFQVDSKGDVHVTVDIRKRQIWYQNNDPYNGDHYGAGALCLLADRKYLWMVQAAEEINKYHTEAKIIFGVEEEMIKSLLYARSLPLTPKGRKRPILHWVRAHKRRIEMGTDVDVRKHLRGIEKFEMGGIDFSIMQPTKENEKRR